MTNLSRISMLCLLVFVFALNAQARHKSSGHRRASQYLSASGKHSKTHKRGIASVKSKKSKKAKKGKKSKKKKSRY